MKVLELRVDFGFTTQVKGNYVKPQVGITLGELGETSKEKRKVLYKQLFEECADAIERQLEELAQ